MIIVFLIAVLGYMLKQRYDQNQAMKRMAEQLEDSKRKTEEVKSELDIQSQKSKKVSPEIIIEKANSKGSSQKPTSPALIRDKDKQVHTDISAASEEDQSQISLRNASQKHQSMVNTPNEPISSGLRNLAADLK